MKVTTAVKRACGFVTPFPFVAEVTVDQDGELFTAREGSYTEAGAAERAALAARNKLTAARRSVGFAPATIYVPTPKAVYVPRLNEANPSLGFA
jgi:hypothetical protein